MHNTFGKMFINFETKNIENKKKLKLAIYVSKRGFFKNITNWKNIYTV